MKEKTYGAYATIYVKSDMPIKEFSDYFAKKTNITNYWTENNEDEPYEIITYAETLGLDLCIENKPIKKFPEFQYEIHLCTSDIAMETCYDRRYEISNWFAKYVCVVCDLMTAIKENDGYLSFTVKDKIKGGINEEYLK